MPTYEYECSKCKKRFDVFQSIKELPLKKCPKCKGKIKRLISAGSGLIFKGSGFYATDYRSKEYKDSARKEKSGSEPPCKSGGKTCKSCPLDKNQSA